MQTDRRGSSAGMARSMSSPGADPVHLPREAAAADSASKALLKRAEPMRGAITKVALGRICSAFLHREGERKAFHSFLCEFNPRLDFEVETELMGVGEV